MDILDIFYNNIINEAANGRIYGWFYYNIIFSTYIREENKYYPAVSVDDTLVPMLTIKNKAEFDKLLVEYVTKALDFYDDSNFPSEILDYKEYDDEDKVCKEKVIIAYLFANATSDDFLEINKYLKRKIDFLNNDLTGIYYLGKSNVLDCDLEIRIQRDKLCNETPYQLMLVAHKKLDDYHFPSVKFGISEGKVYIYAIQNGNLKNSGSFSKKINRLLYKVGEGFNSDLDNSEIYDSGNLKDVTHSFLVAANVALAFFNLNGINEIVIPSILIERYNAKSTTIKVKLDGNKINEEKANEMYLEHMKLQENLTQKFLRTFLRLAHHYGNISIMSYPGELDNYLHLIQQDSINCNNTLLKDTNTLVHSLKNKR